MFSLETSISMVWDYDAVAWNFVAGNEGGIS